MDDLAARLKSLFRRYAAALEQHHGDRLQVARQFSQEVDLLIAQYGQRAINAALDAPGEAWRSVSLH